MLSIGLTTSTSSSSGSISSVMCMSNDHDHCYTKPSQKERTAAQRKRKGQIFLTPVPDHNIQELNTSTSAAMHVSSNNASSDNVSLDNMSSNNASNTHMHDQFQESNNVLLLQNDERSVARGPVITRGRLHGRDVPVELTVVSVKEVWDKSCPLQYHTAFDEEDDVLIPGMITAWPTRLLQKL